MTQATAAYENPYRLSQQHRCLGYTDRAIDLHMRGAPGEAVLEQHTHSLVKLARHSVGPAMISDAIETALDRVSWTAFAKSSDVGDTSAAG